MDLGNYVGVNQRLMMALEKYPDLRIEEHTPEVHDDWPGGPVLICRVSVYRAVDDPLPTIGSVTEPIPGRTPYTKGSELMNGYTSAVGRALGYMGFGIGDSIATAEEVRNARTAQKASEHVEAARPAPANGDGPSDKQLRLLKALGFTGPTPKTMRDASSLIEKLKAGGGAPNEDSGPGF